MNIKEKEILINEIKKYKGTMPIYLRKEQIFDNKLHKTLLEILNDNVLKRKFLIENKYGLLSNLLDKYKAKFDNDILFEIYLKDIKLDPSIFNLIKEEELKYKLGTIKEIVPLLIENNINIKYIDTKYLDESNIIKSIIKNNPDNFYYASDNIKKNKDFILEIIPTNSKYFKYIDNSLKEDKDFIKKAIYINGSILEYTSDNIKNNKEFLLSILKEKPYLIKYVSNDLKQDKELILTLLKINKYIMDYINDTLKQDKDIINLINQ